MMELCGAHSMCVTLERGDQTTSSIIGYVPIIIIIIINLNHQNTCNYQKHGIINMAQKNIGHSNFADFTVKHNP